MGIVAKYKFDGSVYADLIPIFNAEFTNYTITDEVDSENSNHIIRTIESDSLPTLMRFGQSYVEGEVVEDRSLSLLEILDLNISELTTGSQMFRHCENLININCDWSSNKLLNVNGMFYGCKNIVSLNLSNLVNSNHTNLQQMFQHCLKLETISIDGWNATNVLNVIGLFQYCVSLKSLDLHEFKALNLSKINNLFNGCSLLKTIDISNFGFTDDCTLDYIFSNSPLIKYIKCNIPSTIQILSPLLPTRTSDNPGTIIYQGAETLSSEVITELNSKGWNVVTSPQLIAEYKYDSKIYKNLIPVFNEGYMGFVEDEEVGENGIVTRKIEHVELPTLMRFGVEWVNSDTDTANNNRCSSLLEVLNMNTSKIKNMHSMFRRCSRLTSIECNWDTHEMTNIYSIFEGCHRLISINIQNLVATPAIINIFRDCTSLTELDLSTWDISGATNMNGLVRNCNKITRLDISNFDMTKVTDATSAFEYTSSLTDIGMIYCDQFTINKVASLLPTDHNITIWVESDDILQYDQYDHITYKTQKVQDTVHLNSPLLMGDTIEVIDGKTYHVHRCEKFVFDGSLNVYDLSNCIDGVNKYYNFVIPIAHTIYPEPTGNNQISDKLLKGNPYTNKNTFWILAQDNNMEFRLNIENLKTADEYKQYLQANPITAIYELATPYYELISEEPLELTLLDTTDNTINNNSILPSNMAIANKELSTIAIKPSTIYTLSFDKSNVDSEVTIDICGGEQITTVLNKVELTTPSELGSGIRFISSDGCIISNVRLLEGSLVEKAIPRETFEGLKSSFDDGYIIGENLANDKEDYFYEETGNWGNGTILFKQNLKANTTYTLVRKISNIKYGVLNAVSFYDFAYYTDGTYKQDHNCWYGENGWYISKYTPTKDVTKFEIIVGNDNSSGAIKPRITISDYMIFEGDHTHLSEAELMRYIEKGTSHYEEEDYNHVGKYKVEYRVTGKNKCYKHEVMSNSLNIYHKGLKLGHYRISIETPTPFDRNTVYAKGNTILGYMSSDGQGNARATINITEENIDAVNSDYGYIWIYRGNGDISDVTNIQLEEGTVATEYEPYKEDIKTYYLSSPLLEGDTIEDVNGVATHVKRWKRIVLDGNTSLRNEIIQDETTISTLTNLNMNDMYMSNKNECPLLADILPAVSINNRSKYTDCIWRQDSGTKRISIKLSKGRLKTLDLNGFSQWLAENPITVVYQLASPQYETISTDSILCDSYVNGHLDIDTDIPIEKVDFGYYLNNLTYLQPNTKYTIKFESDNIGKIDKLNLGGLGIFNLDVVKGINTFEITTLSELIYGKALAITGIGFNASNIQVVANALDDNGEVKEFDYFKGLKSSFEDGLITDEADENYGKYKVECKIVGKNKIPYWELGNLNINTGNEIDAPDIIRTAWIKVKPNTKYICNRGCTCFQYDKNKKFISRFYITSFTTYSNTRYIRLIGMKDTIESMNIQIEEGTQATPYEPYKESIHTLYLNSPLLKGDKIVVHDGKLCHYHKMGMVVLDGSEGWNTNANGAYWKKINNGKVNGVLLTNTINKKQLNWQGNFVVEPFNELNTVDEFKQWLQQNPTTVVYELKEPYYEPIEPQVSQYLLPSVKDGDMEIITGLPIKIDLTYRTDINGVSSIEEQLANVQSSTDLIDIINSEVDE